MSTLTETFGELPKAEEAVNGLEKVQGAVVRLNPKYQAGVLLSLAVAYGKLSKPEKVENALAQAQQAANFAKTSNEKSQLLVHVAHLYAKSGKWKKALEAAQSIGNEVYAISALTRILIIWKDANSGMKNMDALEKMFRTSI